MWQYKTHVFEVLSAIADPTHGQQWKAEMSLGQIDSKLEEWGADGWEAYSYQTISFPTVTQVVVAMKRYYVE
jgi:hypothetical protein